MKLIISKRYIISLISPLLLSSMLAQAETATNEDCLACHSNPSITGSKNKNPFVDPLQFGRTSHASVGCTSCHNAVPSAHPDNGLIVTKASCENCHTELQAVYKKSIHGENASCGDCHNPHTVRPPTAVSGEEINQQCNKCHEMAQTLTSHSQWLPQARLHMDAVPCISCHAESKDYVITLFLQKRDREKQNGDFRILTNYELGRLLPKGITPTQWIDKDKNNQITLQELREFNLKSRTKDLRLWGMIMPEKLDHNFQLLLNRRDCSFCHLSGPEARQTSYVAFPERDGSFSRVPVEKGAVLDVLFGTPDFYMVGSTRSPLLSLIGLVIVCGGVCFPVAHGTFRYLTRENRKKQNH